VDRQLVFDITTLGRSGGQAVGIVRVVRELARWAAAHLDVSFVFFDLELGAYRTVTARYAKAIIEGRAIVDTSRQPVPTREKPPIHQRVPALLREPALWLRNPRRRAIVVLERLLLSGAIGHVMAERLLSILMTRKHRVELTDSAGLRRTMLPFDVATGEQFELNSSHVLLYAGSDWHPMTIEHVARRKKASNLALAFVCYDTIPLIYPQFFFSDRALSFRKMFDHVASFTDLVLVTAKQIAADVRHHCEENEIPVPRVRVFCPGADLVVKESIGPDELPAGLMSGRYAIFVSTIEPRKGHRLLFSVWQRLLAEGVPQAAGFKLVFVGRRGWLVDDLMAELEAHPSYGSSLVVLPGINDSGLAALYRNAAFGLYPSLYEGYGLPVVELFGYGKAVLTSPGGALKEVVGEFSPCLDPRDEDAWFEALRQWIREPAARQPFEIAIHDRFSHPSWNDAAQGFFEVLADELGLPGKKFVDVT
jgi:glycosyltransferase involved in cell wall biosynthesis